MNFYLISDTFSKGALKDHAKSDTSLPLRHKQPVPKIKGNIKMDTISS